MEWRRVPSPSPSLWLHCAGISRAVYGCSNERFGGCGTVLDVASHVSVVVVFPCPPSLCRLGWKAPFLTNALCPHSQPPVAWGFKCQSGVYEEEAVEIFKLFYAQQNPKSLVWSASFGWDGSMHTHTHTHKHGHRCRHKRTHAPTCADLRVCVRICIHTN